MKNWSVPTGPVGWISGCDRMMHAYIDTVEASAGFEFLPEYCVPLKKSRVIKNKEGLMRG